MPSHSNGRRSLSRLKTHSSPTIARRLAAISSRRGNDRLIGLRQSARLYSSQSRKLLWIEFAAPIPKTISPKWGVHRLPLGDTAGCRFRTHQVCDVNRHARTTDTNTLESCDPCLKCKSRFWTSLKRAPWHREAPGKSCQRTRCHYTKDGLSGKLSRRQVTPQLINSPSTFLDCTSMQHARLL